MKSSRTSILDRADFGPPPPVHLGEGTGAGASQPPRSPAASVQDPLHKPAPSAAEPPRNGSPFSLRKRLAVLLAAIAVPAIAAPGDFGAMAADAPSDSAALESGLAPQAAMPFEKPGMSFPGSAFYYLADPPSQALVALPDSDPLERGAEGGRTIGQAIDAGPAARPFTLAGAGAGFARAQQCLAQAVYYEAASESEGGQRAVAQVVLNRVAHPGWPASVCGVVYQGSARSTGCQFSFTCDGSLARRAGGTPWARAQRIAAEALAGSVYAPIGHATHYHTLWVNPYWAGTLDHVGTIGAHRFYRNRGKAGEKSAFTARYDGAEPSVGARSQASVGTANAAASSAARSTPGAGGAPVNTSARAAPQAASVRAGTVPPAQPEFLADPKLRTAGQAREEYSRAGQWKTDPSALDLSINPAPPAAPPRPARDRATAPKP